MPLPVSYMGTKRQMAGAIAELLRMSPDGALCDLFSGVCAVSTALSKERNVWCNDVEIFCTTIARSFFKSRFGPPNPLLFAPRVTEFFQKNLNALEQRVGGRFEREKTAISRRDLEALTQICRSESFFDSSAHSRAERSRLARRPKTFPYRLFSLTYSGTYLGCYQCAEIDSLKYAFDEIRSRTLITKSEYSWVNLALCQAISRCTTTTGHFAQFLTPSEDNLKRLLGQRNRSVWREWLLALEHLAPIGSPSWRKKNKVFQSDAIKVVRSKAFGAERPSVVYADPPYTDDQYSRYYHLYETLLRYDYPKTASFARYRHDRFSSKFSIKSQIEQALDDLIGAIAALKIDLVLSYPTNGLLEDSRRRIPQIMTAHFGRSPRIYEFDHLHSSMGASKGDQKKSVTEMIYYARAQ